ncbi:hypothetical protein LTR15_012387 [Elasticomyces elasticus]|nr:hypothetical protein LTR15_012387 [Elasticomyces elasticus]
MAQSSGQGTNETQAATSDPQHQHREQPPQTTPSRSQTATDEQQAAITDPSAQREGYCVSVWATGGYLEVDVGEGKYVPVPNTHAREPTREEIHQALVAAGYHERADELADRAYGNVMGTGEEVRRGPWTYQEPKRIVDVAITMTLCKPLKAPTNGNFAPNENSMTSLLDGVHG